MVDVVSVEIVVSPTFQLVLERSITKFSSWCIVLFPLL